MKSVSFTPTFDGWRAVARRLIVDGVEPRGIAWEPAGGEQPSLGLADDGGAGAEVREFRVPRRFVEIARMVAWHRDPERWALLYGVLWRVMNGERALMDVATDPHVHQLLRMEKAVRRESHKMKAFVRFRAVEHEGGTHYVAWFEPEHDVVEHTAPFFAERFASMRWSILTPLRCVHWDGASVSFTPGVPKSEAPDADQLEGLWRTYYASTFNPGRARPGAMRAEMPLRYWKNLPEAQLIAPLLHDAPARVRRMIEQQSTELKRERRRRDLGEPEAVGDESGSR
ncbi:MAG TPA: TIGR03915 family putative DNA repair protein [Longimicrobium sp.]|jgi:DNA polymerase|uniref:TIGR03915 family putative DNA repair protein n=1 Tax=Longimicrobium sp. TaxID=2029185 RepID=UPI002ED9B8EB